MVDKHKTKSELMSELSDLRRQLAEMQSAEVLRKESEDALRERNELLESIFGNIHLMIAYLDPDFNFIRVNDAYAKADNRTTEFYPGRNHFELYPNLENERIFRQVVQTGQPYFAFEKPFVYPEDSNGEVTYWDWSLQRIMNTEGQVTGLVFCLMDRTERKKIHDLLQQERDRFMSILESTEDGVYIINRQHEIEYLSQVAEREFGPVLNRKCYEYFHERTEACPWCKFGEVLRGKKAHWVWTFPKNQKIYDVFESPYRNDDGSISKMGVLHDITQHKRVEEALRLDEARFEALLKLSQKTEASFEEIADSTLLAAVNLSRSQVGFLGFLDEEERIFTIHAWSHGVPKDCVLKDYPLHFPVAKAGLWGEAVRRRKEIIVNDYHDVPSHLKKGYPQGHIPISRFAGIPLFDGKRIVALATVANKEINYDASDVRSLTLLMDTMWKLLQRKKTEEALRESEKQLRFLSAKLLDVQEKERTRLAQELHDSVGQTLVAIKFSVETALRATGRGKARTMMDALEPLVPLIQNAVEEARKIYMELRPTVLDDFGVLAAIDWFCDQIRANHAGLTIEKRIEIEEQQIPPALKTVIYRLIQGALDNTASYAKADEACVSLLRTRDSIELVVEDNGRGFDINDVLSPENPQRGLGLASMKERTELSGGVFSIESSREAGTLVRASWPQKKGAA